MTEAVPLLDVADLTVEVSTRHGIVREVEHVDVRIAKGETTEIYLREDLEVDREVARLRVEKRTP